MLCFVKTNALREGRSPSLYDKVRCQASSRDSALRHSVANWSTLNFSLFESNKEDGNFHVSSERATL